MAMDGVFDWRRADRRLYAVAAITFVLIVLAGFARTYYLRAVVSGPPVPSLLVHLHGAVMTAWVLLFVAQVWLIRTKRARVHMSLGLAGVALAVAIVVIGFFTGVAAAKFGSQSTPPDIPPLAFMIVPLTDIVLFAGLFGAAYYYRKQPATHKRLMLLTAVNFLPPAVARLPFEWVAAAGPLFYFGVPAFIAIGLLVLDRAQTGRVNKPFLIGAIVLIASYPIRIVLSGTDAWMSFAGWLTTWAA
jgi:multisubunit Na+/H+ antiporter MnhC subunit